MFSDGKKYPFPPDMPNALFYADYFSVKNIETGLSIGMGDETESTNETESEGETNGENTIIFSEKNPITIQLLPEKIIRNYLKNFMPVRNEDEEVLNIPQLAFTLRKKENEVV